MKRKTGSSHHLPLLLGLFALTATIAPTGCSSKRKSPPGTQAAASSGQPSATAIAEAARIFKQRCTACHGEKGKGDGPASAALKPKPRDFTSAEWQKTIKDDHLEKIIVYGGAAVGKSPTMPGNPDLDAKADVVAALRLHVRSLAGQ